MTLVLTDLVNLHYVGMLKASHRLRFESKTRQLVPARLPRRQHHLEGDNSLESSVASLIDDAHSALPYPLQYVISPDLVECLAGARIRARWIYRRASPVRIMVALDDLRLRRFIEHICRLGPRLQFFERLLDTVFMT